MSGGIQSNETYNSNSTTNNSAGFIFNSGTNSYTADNTTTPGVNMVFKITSHNTTTKTIEGTFSGTCRNATNAIKTITAGTFKDLLIRQVQAAGFELRVSSRDLRLPTL